MSLTPEEIEQNWKKFRSLCEKTGDRAPVIMRMLDELEDRLCLCPASAKLDYHGAFAGGLVDHSLRVLNNLVRINNAYEWKLNKVSMIIGALFHDIGKVGMPGKDSANDFYLPQTDQWLADKRGEVYKYNNDIQYLSTPDRSLFLMQHYGVVLTTEEWLAIKLNDGFKPEENKKYCLKISPLVVGVQTADYISTMEEKPGIIWPEE
jgi:hypothetical protein